MKKYIIFSIIGLIVLIGVLGGIKGLQINRMIAQGEQYVPPPETVTTAMAQSSKWTSVLTAVGSLEAVQGVMVTAELSGKVARIAFEPGSAVKAGDLMVQQDTTSEAAQLRSAEASMASSSGRPSWASVTMRRSSLPIGSSISWETASTPWRNE